VSHGDTFSQQLDSAQLHGNECVDERDAAELNAGIY
jgi:hypothetical protein